MEISKKTKIETAKKKTTLIAFLDKEYPPPYIYTMNQGN